LYACAFLTWWSIQLMSPYLLILGCIETSSFVAMWIKNGTEPFEIMGDLLKHQASNESLILDWKEKTPEARLASPAPYPSALFIHLVLPNMYMILSEMQISMLPIVVIVCTSRSTPALVSPLWDKMVPGSSQGPAPLCKPWAQTNQLVTKLTSQITGAAQCNYQNEIEKAQTIHIHIAFVQYPPRKITKINAASICFSNRK